MLRYLWMMILLGASVHCVTTASAGDRLQTKALSKTFSVPQTGASRSCMQEDLIGRWQLIKFDSPYRFRDPYAAYLLPYQLFQYSKQGAVQSAHSTKPFRDSTDAIFNAIPSAMSYQFQLGGVIRLSKQTEEVVVETWRCVILTEDHVDSMWQRSLQRGDLVMTLLGREGQTLFVRHLRKVPA